MPANEREEFVPYQAGSTLEDVSKPSPSWPYTVLKVVALGGVSLIFLWVLLVFVVLLFGGGR
jgi:hypothetical protein